MATMMAEVTRGDLVESRHLGNVVVVDGHMDVVARAGDPKTRMFFRSSAKPFQAIPLVASGAADAYGFTTEEVALASASHNATARHQAVVSSMRPRPASARAISGAASPLSWTMRRRPA